MRFLKIHIFAFLLVLAFPARTIGFETVDLAYHVTYAEQYIGYNEKSHREEIKELVGVDPVIIEWCAAFVNAMLRKNGLGGSELVSEYPLMARSFLDWGHTVETPQRGDIMIFKRGESWQGHVGFYIDTVVVNGKTYYEILGGNQKNGINISRYSASRLISIKRATK